MVKKLSDRAIAQAFYDRTPDPWECVEDFYNSVLERARALEAVINPDPSLYLAELRLLVEAGASDDHLANWLSNGAPYRLWGSEGDRMCWSTRETVNRAMGRHHV